MEVVEISESDARTLFDADVAGTKVHVEVYISDQTGDLVVAGQDIGAAPRQVFDKDEYEYFLNVPAAEKDRLLLLLMQHVFAGEEQTRSAIAEWLDAGGIPYGLHSF